MKYLRSKHLPAVGLAVFMMAGSVGMPLGAAIVSAAPAHAACPGYSASTCILITVKAHHHKAMKIPGVRAGRLVVTAGNVPSALMVKRIGKPAGAPKLSVGKHKKVTFFTFQTSRPVASVVWKPANKKERLYAYKPSSNSWAPVRKGSRLHAGTVYAVVTG